MFGIFYGLFAAFRGLGSIAADNNSKYRGKKHHYLENIKCYSDDRGRLWDYETDRQVALGTSRINGHRCVVDVKTGEEIRDLEWEWGQRDADERFAHGAFAVRDPYTGTRPVIPRVDGIGKHCQYEGKSGEKYYIIKEGGRRYYVGKETHRILRSTDHQRLWDVESMERRIQRNKFYIEIKEKSPREQDIENIKKHSKDYDDYLKGKGLTSFFIENGLDISDHQQEVDCVKLEDYEKIVKWHEYNDKWEKIRDEAWNKLPWHDYEAAIIAFMNPEWRAANPDVEPPPLVRDSLRERRRR